MYVEHVIYVGDLDPPEAGTLFTLNTLFTLGSLGPSRGRYVIYVEYVIYVGLLEPCGNVPPGRLNVRCGHVDPSKPITLNTLFTLFTLKDVSTWNNVVQRGITYQRNGVGGCHPSCNLTSVEIENL